MFAPLYLVHLGIEAFAVISAAIVVNAILGMLDSGISPLILRDVGSLNNDPAGKREILGSYELVYIAIFVSLLAVYVIFIGLNSYLESSFLDKYAILIKYSSIFILEFCFQLGCRFYVSALQGMERHVSANSYYLAMAFLRTGFIVIVISMFPTLDAYFYWQLVISILFMFILRAAAYSGDEEDINNPFLYKRLFWSRLLSLRKMALIACVAVLYGQADRLVFLITSDLLDFPVYTVAGSFALIVTSVGLLLIPLMLPKLNQNANITRKDAILRVTHTGCYLLSSVIAAHLVILGHQLLGVFFDDPSVVAESYRYLVLLIIGNFLSSVTISLYIRNISDGRFRHHLAIVGSVGVLAFPVYFLLHSWLGLIGIPVGFVLSQATISILYVILSARAISVPSSIFRFLIFPLMAATLIMGIDSFIVNEINSIGFVVGFHPYLVFCVTFIPIMMLSLLLAPLGHLIGWGFSLKSDLLALNAPPESG